MGRIKRLMELSKLRGFRNKLVSIGFGEGFCDQEELRCGKEFREKGKSLFVTIDFEKHTVYLRTESDCGGLLRSRYEHIPKESLEDFDKFVDWLDSIVE